LIVSLAVLESKLNDLRLDHEKLEIVVEKQGVALNLALRQQSWILGLGVGLGGAGMLLVQLVIQKVFG